MFRAPHGRRSLGNTTRLKGSLQIVSLNILALPRFTEHAALSTRITCPLRDTFMNKAPMSQGCCVAGWTHISTRCIPPLAFMSSVSDDKVHHFNSVDGAITEPIRRYGWLYSSRHSRVSPPSLVNRNIRKLKWELTQRQKWFSSTQLLSL